MPAFLSLIAIALLGVAIAIQLYYLRGLEKAGVEMARATKVITYINIGLLAAVALGIAIFGLLGQLVSTGM